MTSSESISAKLRRWADESESDNRRHFYPTFNACDDLGIKIPDDTFVSERELFRRIAAEIDREKREITERYARQSWMNPADAIAKLATGEIEWDELHQAIERYYLPRPLFEDGEPVQLGDTVVDKLRGEMLVTRMCHVGKGVYFNESHNPWGKKLRKTRIAYAPGERVERPEPKVLDADGAPIVVGDKVWILPGKHCETFPLYGYKSGVEYTVSENESASHKENGRICITGGDCTCGYPMPEQVTHREPDTQERIDDDATMPPRSYYAKRIGHDVGLKDDEEVWTAVTAHLLRRQRELDGRDA